MSKHKQEKAVEPTSNDEEVSEDQFDGSVVDPDAAKKVTFASLGLNEVLCNTCEKMGWTHASAIQAASIPYALQGKDVIGLAQTGSGKTASFALPILHNLLLNPQQLYALVMAPTRELAFQISEQFEALGSAIGVTCAVVVGGIDAMTQAMALAKKPHIVIGTPGRILYHLQNTRGFSLKSIKFLVLDEADRLLNMDFEDAIDAILKVMPRERTSFLFSATMTNKVAKLQRASLHNPVKVQVGTSKYATVDTLVQQYLFVPEKFKDCYLTYLLTEFTGHSAIVFTAQCATAQRISLVLRHLGFKALPLHGKMPQTKRLGALNQFKAGGIKILIATDVASRGLDIPLVDLVLNYDIPQHTKDYIHRVGRTARAGHSGRALNLVTQYDVEQYQKIEEYIGKKLDLYKTEEDQVLVLMERVAEAQRYAAMDMRESGFGKKRKRDANEGEEKTLEKTSNPHKKSRK